MSKISRVEMNVDKGEVYKNTKRVCHSSDEVLKMNTKTLLLLAFLASVAIQVWIILLITDENMQGLKCGIFR